MTNNEIFFFLSGESLRPQIASQLYAYLNPTANIYHLYGPTECIFAATFHKVTKDDLQLDYLPIGRPLPGYTCYVLDTYYQHIICDSQVGQLFIGGDAVFAGYLNQPDLTQKALVPLPGKKGLFYQTGDLVRVDSTKGVLNYVGRADFQVKLRGQRIELGEIETTIMKSSSEINNCTVVKLHHNNEDHLVAYLQTTAHLDNHMLREYCIKYLPLYMIPSLFILLDRFPLNPNGKLDRKALPSPDFSLLLSSTMTIVDDQPQSNIEKQVSIIWCQILHLKSIPSISTNFFKLGGNSLLLMKLHHVYQKQFHHSINISELFRHATIMDHAQLLQSHQLTIEPQWHSFHINKGKSSINKVFFSFKNISGPASFAQTRLYLDERLRFTTSNNPIATYHIPLVYEVIQTSISLKRLKRALTTIIEKHKILRTRLMFDDTLGLLQQEILDEVPLFVIETKVDNERDIEKVLYDEETNPNLFDLNQGKVFRCHIIRRSTYTDENLISISDIIVFNFHHIAFDGASIDIFFKDLRRAYSTDKPLPCCSFDYIDYSIHEKEMKMDDAQAFWKQHLDEYSETYLQLPYDRIPIENSIRSGQGATITCKLSFDLVDRILTFIENHNTTLHQLGLTVFYIFLFKLTQETNLTTLTVTANRYRVEIENMIGVFVNTVPHQIMIKPHINFTSFLNDVKDLVLNTLSYAHVPFQHITSNKSTSTFQTLFDVDIQQENEITLGSDICLRSFIPNSTDPNNVAKFDLTCTLHYNVKMHSMVVVLNGSTDLFETNTIQLMAKRFESLLNQIFTSPMSIPICEYSLLLSHEHQLLHQLNNGDQLLDQSNPLPIHQQFAYQAEKYSQKLALILDEQSLTYAELLHSSQLLAQHLIDRYEVKRGDIIGQCVERSIEMSIGIMGILFSDASYLPVSPQQSVERLQLLIDLVQPKCILTHCFTEKQIENICLTVNLSKILCSNTISVNDIHLNNSTLMNDIAFSIFTSGSTGIPRVVPISHLQFIHHILSYRQVQLHRENDITIQMANCSFDEHVNEYMGSFICGATLVLLRPHGNLDTHYLCRTIKRNQATLIDFVPTTMAMIYEYLNEQLPFNGCNYLTTLRLVTVGGKIFFMKWIVFLG